MTRRHVGVLEVAADIATHAKALHDPPGPDVDGGCERDDLVKADGVEAVIEGGPRPLGGVTVAPLIGGEPPADLDRGREVRGKRGRPEAAISDKASDVFPLHGPEAVSEFRPPLADECHESAGSLLRVGLREELHHHGVGIHGDEWIQVRLPPVPEQEPVGDDQRARHVWVRRG